MYQRHISEFGARGRSRSPKRLPGAQGLQAWTGAGVAWAAVNAAALAVGLFPGLIVAEPRPTGGAALATVAAAQVAFALMAAPLAWAKRVKRNDGRLTWGEVCEMALWLAMAAPFTVAAAYLSDAWAPDVVRVATLTVAALAAAAILARPASTGQAGASAVVWIGAMAVMGGAAAAYVVAEFGPAGSAGWLWRACPVLLAWTTGASPQQAWTTTSVWAAAAWPIAAAAAWGAWTLVARRRKERKR